MLKFDKIAAAFFTFGKPDVTKQVLNSILQNKKYHYDIDWYCFHDGAVNEFSGLRYISDEVNQQVLEIVRNSDLDFKEIIVNELNEGIARQKHKSHQLFRDYSLVYFFEDDLLLGNYYLRLLKVLAESFPQQVGTLHNHLNSSGHNLVYPMVGEARLWGYYMPRQVYLKIKDGWEHYHNRIKNMDYIGRKAHGVKRAPRQDINLTNLLVAVGRQKLQPRITRARNIGRYGHIAFQKGGNKWERDRLHLQPTNISDPKNDKAITRFIRG